MNELRTTLPVSNQDSPSSIEDLPNELFLEVFNYLTPKDLFNAFGKLNVRFSTLTQSTYIRLRMRNDNVHLLSMVKEEQIKSLNLNEFADLNMLINHFQINHLTQLERLDVTLADVQSIDSFLQFIFTLNNLKSLYIKGRYSVTLEKIETLVHILTEVPFLPPFSTRLINFEIIIPDLIPYYGYTLQPNPLSTLKYFSIHSICLDDLTIVLSWMPQLSFLKITYAFIVNDEDGQLHQHDLTTRALMKMPANTSLRRLDIGVCHRVTCTVSSQRGYYLTNTFFFV